MVRVARLELALPKKPDFESSVSTDSTTPANFYTTLYNFFKEQSTALGPCITSILIDFKRRHKQF